MKNLSRSLYTGSLYKFLQSDDHEPEAQTIEEMAQRDFLFYMVVSYDDLTQDSVAMRGRCVTNVQPSRLTFLVNLQTSHHTSE